MKKKVLCAALSAVLSLTMLAGCGGSGGSSSAKPANDRAGNAITVPEKVESIVSMAPSATEVLISMGLGDKIVAIDTNSAYMSFASELKADLPQFDLMNPDNEAIVALSPDIVFTTGMSYSGGSDVYAAVKAAGVCVADIPTPESISGIEEDIRFIGACVGASDKADEIVQDMEKSIKDIKDTAASIPDGDKKTVLYVMSVPTSDYPDVYTCGKGTYMDEVFTLVGLKNIAGDIDYAWPALSEEDVISKNPDVIIVGDNYTPDAVNAILTKSGWESISAVQNGEVYLIDGDAFNQPNQGVIDAALEIGNFAYPDDFDAVAPAA